MSLVWKGMKAVWFLAFVGFGTVALHWALGHEANHALYVRVLVGIWVSVGFGYAAGWSDHASKSPGDAP